MDKQSLEIANGLGAGTERIDAHSHIIFAEQAAKYALYFKVKDDDVDWCKCFSNDQGMKECQEVMWEEKILERKGENGQLSQIWCFKSTKEIIQMSLFLDIFRHNRYKQEIIEIVNLYSFVITLH